MCLYEIICDAYLLTCINTEVINNKHYYDLNALNVLLRVNKFTSLSCSLEASQTCWLHLYDKLLLIEDLFVCQ